jgi:hypothetical protein
MQKRRLFLSLYFNLFLVRLFAQSEQNRNFFSESSHNDEQLYSQDTRLISKLDVQFIEMPLEIILSNLSQKINVSLSAAQTLKNRRFTILFQQQSVANTMLALTRHTGGIWKKNEKGYELQPSERVLRIEKSDMRLSLGREDYIRHISQAGVHGGLETVLYTAEHLDEEQKKYVNPTVDDYAIFTSLTPSQFQLLADAGFGSPIGGSVRPSRYTNLTGAGTRAMSRILYANHIKNYSAQIVAQMNKAMDEHSYVILEKYKGDDPDATIIKDINKNREGVFIGIVSSFTSQNKVFISSNGKLFLPRGRENEVGWSYVSNQYDEIAIDNPIVDYSNNILSLLETKANFSISKMPSALRTNKIVLQNMKEVYRFTTEEQANADQSLREQGVSVDSKEIVHTETERGSTRLSNVLWQIHRKTGLNILSDDYLNTRETRNRDGFQIDENVPKEKKERTLEALLTEIGTSFLHKIVYRDGVLYLNTLLLGRDLRSEIPNNLYQVIFEKKKAYESIPTKEEKKYPLEPLTAEEMDQFCSLSILQLDALLEHFHVQSPILDQIFALRYEHPATHFYSLLTPELRQKAQRPEGVSVKEFPKELQREFSKFSERGMPDVTPQSKDTQPGLFRIERKIRKSKGKDGIERNYLTYFALHFQPERKNTIPKIIEIYRTQ